MVKLSVSPTADINYLAKIVHLDTFVPHPDSEVSKLKCCKVDGYTIICSIDSEPGDYVYFPAGCCLNPELLSYANLYRDPTKNLDTSESGMFESNGRVKMIKLRGCLSEGFILPLETLNFFVISIINQYIDYKINEEFDCLHYGKKDIWFCKKYVVPHKECSKVSVTKRPNKVCSGQFRLHYETVNIKKCPDVINSDDIIQISSKVHGKSGISAYLLCKPVFTLRRKVGQWLYGKKLYEYDYVHASRKVIKYDHGNDVWGYADAVIRPHLTKGMSVYYEIIGFEPNGNYIQKNFDYGYTKPTDSYEYNKNFGIRIYRVTLTDPDGNVYEFSPREVQSWATQHGLVPVKELYYGKAGDLYSDNFIDNLAKDKRFFMEEYSPECVNKVPQEGVVIKIDGKNSQAYKLKCFKFFNMSQKDPETNIED